MQTDTVVSASPDVVTREVGGELVLLHLGSGTYFGLNPVGGRVWQLLEQADQPISQLCAAIEAEFDGESAMIEADLLALAMSLEQQGLISRAAA